MSIAEKLTTIAENQQKVYESGKSALWDVIQNYGNRTAYQYAFMEWNSDYIHPKYKIVPKSGHMAQIFYKSKVKKIEAEYFDFSNVPTAAYASNSLYYTFQFCSELEEIEVELPGDFLSGTFHSCSKLHTIAKINVKETTTFTANPFYNCFALKEIRFNGTIGTNLDLHWSTQLSADSIENIFNCLSTTSTGQELTLPTTAEATYNAKYGDNAYDTKVSSKSNWQIKTA